MLDTVKARAARVAGALAIALLLGPTRPAAAIGDGGWHTTASGPGGAPAAGSGEHTGSGGCASSGFGGPTDVGVLAAVVLTLARVGRRRPDRRPGSGRARARRAAPVR